MAYSETNPLEEQSRRAGGLRGADIECLHQLVGFWQLLADLSFADLMLIAPIQNDPDNNLLVLAQVRPDSTQTLFSDDHVGTALLGEHSMEIYSALSSGKIQRSIADTRGVERWVIPVSVNGSFSAVIVREGAQFGGRRVSALEEAYVESASTLFSMITYGTIPYDGIADWEPQRVSDGLMQIAPNGLVLFASPNAIAAHRRLGVSAPLPNHSLNELPGGKGLMTALAGGVPLEAEVEIGGAVVTRRLIPFLSDTEVVGGMILVQDVTEVRRRDKELMYKDAVIREIHHRVKNNLQTIASLLRLQARRLVSEEARAALEESVRRVSTIALVHETLSQASGDRVFFGDVVRGVVRMLTDGLGLDEMNVTCNVTGDVGELSAIIATPLSLVITELIQNAAEHAFDGAGGAITVELSRDDDDLKAVVEDDGRGLPADFSFASVGLGLRIVQALVDQEMGGSITFNNKTKGSRFAVRVPLERL